MLVNRPWTISVLLSLFIVAVPTGIALTLLPLIVFVIPLSSSELWDEPSQFESPQRA